MIAQAALYLAGKLDEGLDNDCMFESLDRQSRVTGSFTALASLPGMEGASFDLDWGEDWKNYKLLEFSILRDVLCFKFEPILVQSPA